MTNTTDFILNGLQQVNEATGSSLFNSFWIDNKSRFLSQISEDKLLRLSSGRNQNAVTIKKDIEAFHAMIKKIPLSVAVFSWLKTLTYDAVWARQYIDWMNKMLNQQLLVLIVEGKERTIEEFDFSEHLAIIDNIRCVKEWGYLEKDQTVGCYLQFSRGLNDWTMGLIASAYDPDRDRVSNKVLRYERFMEFIQHLSNRDALIAKLLYYGAPSIEDVVSLCVQDVEVYGNRIDFSGNVITFPKHVIVDLKEYIQLRSSSNPLIFINGKGEGIDRSHLPHAFARASVRKEGDVKITPSMLLQTLVR